LLIERGADVRAKADDGKTPLDYAVANHREDVAALLRTAADR
jgi:ankyrin repeat protein